MLTVFLVLFVGFFFSLNFVLESFIFGFGHLFLNLFSSQLSFWLYILILRKILDSDWVVNIKSKVISLDLVPIGILFFLTSWRCSWIQAKVLVGECSNYWLRILMLHHFFINWQNIIKKPIILILEWMHNQIFVFILFSPISIWKKVV